MRNGATREGFVRIRLPVFCSSPRTLPSTALNLHPRKDESYLSFGSIIKRHARCLFYFILSLIPFDITPRVTLDKYHLFPARYAKRKVFINPATTATNDGTDGYQRISIRSSSRTITTSLLPRSASQRTTLQLTSRMSRSMIVVSLRSPSGGLPGK
jgi:hypothetical protein